MLVVTRKQSEQVVLDLDGQRITITVLGTHTSMVRLGIEAPQTVTINRGEIQDRIDKGVPRDL